MKKVLMHGVPVVFVIMLMFAGSAMGAGFALIEQSVSGLGNAFAGGSASAEDASTIFFNPAGLTRLKGTQIVTGAHLVMPSAKFHNDGSTHALQGFFGLPALTGGNGGQGGVTGVVPNLYVSRQVNEKFWLGLGINAPFGLSTDYDKNWVGRYHGITSEMMTININPSFALKINDKLSIGAGLNVQYLKAKLTNAIDYGTICVSQLGLGCLSAGLIPQETDGQVKLTGDSWGIGLNAGLLYEFTPSTRVGVSYRSRVHHRVEGRADFSNSPSLLVARTGGWFTDTAVDASVDMPASASVSVVHQINPEWEVMADVTWTGWSTFEELRFDFHNGQPDGVTTEKWKDNYRYSGGVTYKPGNWKFRAGIAYDTTPVRSAEYRTPRIPDGNRLWLAGGLGYKISDRVSVDCGYAHLFVDDPEIKKTPTGEDALRGGLKGRYDASVDIVSAQIKISF